LAAERVALQPRDAFHDAIVNIDDYRTANWNFSENAPARNRKKYITNSMDVKLTISI